MIIGVPKEIKPDEYRVAVTPGGVEQLKRAGHRVLVERGAGVGSGARSAPLHADCQQVCRRCSHFVRGNASQRCPTGSESRPCEADECLQEICRTNAGRADSRGVARRGAVQWRLAAASPGALIRSVDDPSTK